MTSDLWIRVLEVDATAARTQRTIAVGPYPSIERRAIAIKAWSRAPGVLSAIATTGRPRQADSYRTPLLTPEEQRQVEGRRSGLRKSRVSRAVARG